MKLRNYVSLIIVAIGLTVGVSNAQVQKKISDQDLKDLLARIDTDTDRFGKTADKAMDKSGFDGTPREDELNKHLKNFQKATEALKNDHSAADAKTHFETVLHHGVAIENFLRRNPLDGVQEDWEALRADLGELARGFNITWDQGHALGARVGEADIKNLLQHIEDMADKYKLSLDAALDNSPLNNTNAEDEINAINAAAQQTRPNATKLREPTASYNCHSYAWYSTSASSGNRRLNSSATPTASASRPRPV